MDCATVFVLSFSSYEGRKLCRRRPGVVLLSLGLVCVGVTVYLFPRNSLMTSPLLSSSRSDATLPGRRRTVSQDENHSKNLQQHFKLKGPGMSVQQLKVARSGVGGSLVEGGFPAPGGGLPRRPKIPKHPTFDIRIKVEPENLNETMRTDDYMYVNQGANGTKPEGSGPTVTDEIADKFFPEGTLEGVALKINKPLPVDISTVNHYWQAVEDDVEIYLYSAYYDDRPTLDQPLIRVIGIGEVAIRQSIVVCLLWYAGQEHPDVSLAEIGQIGPRITPLANVKYEQVTLSCGVIDGKGPAAEVSVITTNKMQPSTLLPVQIPERARRDIEFGHCMSVVYWKVDPYRMVEWLELHRMWGVGEVTIYNNTLDKLSSMVLQYYAKTGFVDFRQAPSVLDDTGELTILMNMSPVINDCLYRNMHRYRWVVVTDMDELIVPRTQANYHDMLKAIDADRGQTESAKSYMFNNVYFFTDLGAVTAEPWYLWSTRYRKHIKPNTFGYSVKSITDPYACAGLQNHLCWRRIPKFKDDIAEWNIDVNQTLAMNYHYKKCHLDQFEGEFGKCKDSTKEYFEDSTMLRFQKELDKRVAKRLLDIGLLQTEKPKPLSRVSTLISSN